MKKVDFPNITTVVQAEPWEKGHVARITSFRPVTNTPKQHRIIEASVLPKWASYPKTTVNAKMQS